MDGDSKIDAVTPSNVDAEKEASEAAAAGGSVSLSSGGRGETNDRWQRDLVDYPSKHPDFHRVSWSEATKPSNQIEMGKRYLRWDDASGGDNEDDDDQSLDEFFEVPRCRGVVEWLVCLVFDCLLLVVEVGVSLWMASGLFEQDLVTQYQAILIVLVLPSLFNSVAWLWLRSNYVGMSTAFILFLVLLGFPSPLFVYVWHLYLAMFAKRCDAVRSKQLANVFRIVQAVTCSVPVVLINIITLVNVFRVPGREQSEMDIGRLFDHLAQVQMHGLAFFISVTNIVRASCLFNERQTFTLLFTLVGFPFVLLTVIVRLMALGIIVAFVDPEWTALLILGLTLGNVLLYFLCRKRGTVLAMPNEKRFSTATARGRRSNKFLRPIQAESPDDTESNASNRGCGNCNCIEVDCSSCLELRMRNRSYTYAVGGGDDGGRRAARFGGGTLKTVVMSFASIVVPCSYTNDRRCHHPRLKGGTFLLLNHLWTSIVLGLVLGYTIVHYVPNTVRGVMVPQPSLRVRIPGSQVIVEAAGLDISLDLPDTNMDLGTMPQFSATVNTDSKDYHMGVAAPFILCIVLLPFVVMRASLMELDCFVARRKLLDVVDIETYAYKKHRRNRKGGSSSSSNPANDLVVEKVTLIDTVTKNAENQELKLRMYTALGCGIVGMVIMVAFFMLLGAFTYMNVS